MYLSPSNEYRHFINEMTGGNGKFLDDKLEARLWIMKITSIWRDTHWNYHFEGIWFWHPKGKKILLIFI